jgi:hypothetical protein
VSTSSKVFPTSGDSSRRVPDLSPQMFSLWFQAVLPHEEIISQLHYRPTFMMGYLSTLRDQIDNSNRFGLSAGRRSKMI